MTLNIDEDFERIVKSTERIRDLGEVFTPSATVTEMLDLLPATVWSVHPAKNFLEPACGDGNFLVDVLARKLHRVGEGFRKAKLPAGKSVEAAQFHGLEALASVYAVDISADNIIGGTPGHEIGARARLLSDFARWNQEVLGKRINDRSLILRSATWVTDHNLIVGNAMPRDAAGQLTQRDDLPLIEYEFRPADRTVVLRRTSLGDVIEASQVAASDALKLFGPTEPAHLWEGNATSLFQADRVTAPRLRGPARNGARHAR